MGTQQKRIVIALGGNALGNSLSEQMTAVKTTAKAIADLIEEGHQVVIVHGNGPQVGTINNAMTEYAQAQPGRQTTPLSVCVAMSQAYIGYDLQNAMREEFLNRGMKPRNTSTMITQIVVEQNDEAFADPSKPIGQFMSMEEALKEAGERGWTVKEDAGRGYRRVVASPKPREIVEINAIRAMVDDGNLVICCGGGGIPVVREGNHLAGAQAVIDKDFAAALLAEQLGADMLIILTAVEKVAVNFGKPDQRWLDHMSIAEAETYCSEGQFAPGSMLPKVQAGMQFAASGRDRVAMITLLEKAREAVRGKTGTIITQA
ncbi:MAG: carbamate kinase [Eubacteriales bacterium]|nr:carbamate kinase [Eubacteriales bacterium]